MYGTTRGCEGLASGGLTLGSVSSLIESHNGLTRDSPLIATLFAFALIEK
jgi:hypothetical protein